MSGPRVGAPPGDSVRRSGSRVDVVGSAVAGKARPASRLRLLWGHRRILRLLVLRDLRVKYADTTLGYVWSILEPLVLAAIYWLLFTKLMTRQVGEAPYIVYLLCALLPWQWTQGSMRESMRTFNKDSKLVRSAKLPREMWVLRVIFSRMADLVLALPVIALFAALNDLSPDWQVVFWPVAMLIQAVLLTGLGLALAPIALLYKDVERVIRLVLRMMFFLSPVLYGIHDVEKRVGGSGLLADLYILNPFAGIFDLYRTAFFADSWSGWPALTVSIVAAPLMLVIGALVFRRYERAVLKEI